jgi:hypothetical protein
MWIRKKLNNLSIMLLMLLMCAFCFSSCGVYKEPIYCELCGEKVKKAVCAEGDNGEYCYDCVIGQGYERCCECNCYYENDWWDCNDWYCHYCFKDKGKGCFLCWQSFGAMTTITVDGENFYICPDCITDYFANIDPMKPVDYCIECGKIYPLGDYYYEHYIFSGASMCQDCLIEKGYKQCERCGKYTNEGLLKGICGYCIEKEQGKGE